MARWPINAWMRVMVAIAIGLDCILIDIDVKSIAISSDCVLMSILSNWLRSARIVYQWVYCPINCNQLGLCINWCQRWFWWWVRWWVWQSVQWWFRRLVWRWVWWLVSLGCAGLSTSVKCLTALSRGFYGYQPRGFNGLVVKQTRCFTDSLMSISQEGIKAL